MLKELTQRTPFYDVWSKFVSKGDINCIPIQIRQSWERCQKADVDPPKEITIMRIDQNAIRKRIDEQSDLYSTELIPIFNRSGNEVAFLLKLKREKAPKVISGRVSYRAQHTFDNIIGTSPNQ